MVVIGIALATSSEGAEPKLALAPIDPTIGRLQHSSPNQRDLAGRNRQWLQEEHNSSRIFSWGGFGTAAFGSQEAHDLSFGSVNAGWILTDVIARDHFFKGNLEVIGELFSGLSSILAHAI